MAKPMNLFLQISKVDAAQRVVYGTLTEEIADKSKEVFDYEGGKQAFIDWSDQALERSKGKSKGNLRAMHGKVAAGKFIDLHFDDALKIISGGAKVSDDQEWAKVEDGTYTGFSIGGDYAKRWTDPNNANLTRYIPTIHEVSLVDNPCVGTATFDVIKADGSKETRSFKTTQAEKTVMENNKPQDSEDATQVWKAIDGSTHATKSEAKKHSDVVKAAKATAEVTDPLAAATAKLDEVLKSAEGETTDDAANSDDAQAAGTDEPAAGDTGEQTPDASLQVDVEAAAADAQAAEAAERQAEAEQTGDEGGNEKSISGKLKKGVSDIARLACIIQDLEWLQGCMEYEAIMEQDGSANPGKLDEIMKTLCAFLMDVVAEETGEMFKATMTEVEKADAIGELAKAGARNSKRDAEMMAKAHDHASEIQKCMKSMGYDTGEDEDAEKSVISALTKMHDENKGLSKFINDQAELVKSLTERVEQFANAPAPRRGVLKAVGKTADGVSDPANSETVTDTTDTVELIKQAHRRAVLINN